MISSLQLGILPLLLTLMECVTWRKELNQLDAVIDKGTGTEVEAEKRMEVLAALRNIDHIHSMDLAQKAKIKWDRFAKPFGRRANIDYEISENISSEDHNRTSSEKFLNRRLKRLFRAVAQTNPQALTALIPKSRPNLVKDFRPISLIGSIYKIIAKILSNRLVNVLGDIVNEVQSAFIAERQMLDGPFILNEILQWCKWRNWIQSCLTSSKGSILVNGCPTNEFQFYKGLKQVNLYPLPLYHRDGDPSFIFSKDRKRGDV
ncbi:hypothetical protein Tco_0001523 [Tanacetum coccineum]